MMKVSFAVLMNEKIIIQASTGSVTDKDISLMYRTRTFNVRKRTENVSFISNALVVFLNNSSVECDRPAIFTSADMRSCSITGGNSYFCHETLRFHFWIRVYARTHARRARISWMWRTHPPNPYRGLWSCKLEWNCSL